MHAYGRTGLLVELADLAQVLGLHDELTRDPPEGVVETVPAVRTLLVNFDRRVTTARSLAAQIRARPLAPRPATASAEVVVPVRYDGPDLADVAALTGLDAREVVRRHAAASYVVALIGFAPGFYFLANGDSALRVPRKSSPRVSVPKGAVGLAGEFTGVYPRAGPGGWQLIGHTAADLWDPTAVPAARLTPGTRVRFVAGAA